MRRALIALASLTACGGVDAPRIVEFEPPPGFTHGTQLLTALDRRYVVAPGQTVVLPALEPSDEDVVLEAQLFDAPPDALWLETGELLANDGASIPLPKAASGWTARFDGERVGAWESVEPKRVELPTSCPTFVTRELDVDFDGEITGLVTLGEDAAVVADRHQIHRWQPDGWDLVATTTRSIDRLAGEGRAFVGLDGRDVASLEDGARLGDAFELGSALVTVAVAPDRSEAFVVGADGTLARFADGAWERLARTEGSGSFHDLTWVAPGEVVVVSGAPFVERWRSGALHREDLDPALLVDYLTASVRWDDAVFVIATTRRFERVCLVDGVEGWEQMWRDVDLLEDLVALSAHPRGVFFGGTLGHYGIFGPRGGWKCSIPPVARDAVVASTFVPPRHLLFQTKGRFPERVWVTTLTPP